MNSDYVYCHRGDHWPRKERMLGNACVECRAKQAAEDASSLASVASRAVWGEKGVQTERKGIDCGGS